MSVNKRMVIIDVSEQLLEQIDQFADDARLSRDTAIRVLLRSAVSWTNRDMAEATGALRKLREEIVALTGYLSEIRRHRNSV